MCTVCQENSPKLTQISCGSEVPHCICEECEDAWRAKMPVDPEENMRIMKCPMCRKPEDPKKRSSESLIRELKGKYRPRTITVEMEIPGFQDFAFTIPDFGSENAFMVPAPVPRQVSIPRPLPRSVCASGRDCHSRSRTGRTTTHLKCAGCNLVFCCRNCRRCIRCVP